MKTVRFPHDNCIQLFQFNKVVPEQSGKVEYEREKLADD